MGCWIQVEIIYGLYSKNREGCKRGIWKKETYEIMWETKYRSIKKWKEIMMVDHWVKSLNAGNMIWQNTYNIYLLKEGRKKMKCVTEINNKNYWNFFFVELLFIKQLFKHMSFIFQMLFLIKHLRICCRRFPIFSYPWIFNILIFQKTLFTLIILNNCKQIVVK